MKRTTGFLKEIMLGCETHCILIDKISMTIKNTCMTLVTFKGHLSFSCGTLSHNLSVSNFSFCVHAFNWLDASFQCSKQNLQASSYLTEKLQFEHAI